jgi:hypothetical protein
MMSHLEYYIPISKEVFSMSPCAGHVIGGRILLRWHCLEMTAGSIANPRTPENAVRRSYMAALIVYREKFTCCQIPRSRRPAVGPMLAS